MAVRQKYRKNAEPHLEAGETIQVVFGAQTHRTWMAVATGFIPFMFFNTYVVVVVTDRRIFLGKASPFVPTKVGEILASLPRQTMIGPASGRWFKTEALGGRLYVHKRFHEDIAEADLVSGQGAVTQQPHPPS